MKNKLILVTVVIFLKSVTLFSQEQASFFNSSEIYTLLLSEVKKNTKGELNIKMKSEGTRYLIFIDNNAPIVSVYNKVYTVKDSIRIVSKGGLNVKILKNKSIANHWNVEKRERTPFRKEVKNYKGGFKFENGVTLKSLKVEEYNLIYNERL